MHWTERHMLYFDISVSLATVIMAVDSRMCKLVFYMRCITVAYLVRNRPAVNEIMNYLTVTSAQNAPSP